MKAKSNGLVSLCLSRIPSPIRVAGPVIAKFHYTGPIGPDQTKSADFVGDPRGPNGPSGSGRARLVEFSYYGTLSQRTRRSVEKCYSRWSSWWSDVTALACYGGL